MRHLAVVVAAALVFAMIAPAFAQPFADVPTNHWAYDAIAELAAKGLVEGYPDGTFKGDRAMTRYEMAMVVARLLARIESIQIPSPQAPQVTRANLDTIQRLINEFRAELAALGVRVTALEEELNAIKARLDNVRITGAARIIYNMQRTSGPGLGSSGPGPACGAIGGNGNPNTCSVDSSNYATLPRVREELHLKLDGSVAPNVHLIIGLYTGGGGSNGNTYNTFNSSCFGFGPGGVSCPGASAGNYMFGALDNLYFDWKDAFGLPIEFWLGRFGGAGEGGGVGGTGAPVQFGPFGLLFNSTGDTWSDSTNESGANIVDGLAMFGNWSSLADLKIQAIIARVNGGLGGSSFIAGEDAYGVDANVQLMPGLRLGGYYVSNNFTAGGPPAAASPASLGPLYHVYGPGSGSMNPVTSHCPVQAGAGIQCPASGSGGGGYVGWDIFPGLHFDGEYAVWNDAVLGGNDSGYQVNFTLDLGTLTGIGHNLSLDLGYANFGQNFYPPYGNAEPDSFAFDVIYPGNANGFIGDIFWDPAPNWTLYLWDYSGNFISNGQAIQSYQGGVKYKLAPGATLDLYIRDIKINGIDQATRYRAQITYKF